MALRTGRCNPPRASSVFAHQRFPLHPHAATETLATAAAGARNLGQLPPGGFRPARRSPNMSPNGTTGLMLLHRPLHLLLGCSLMSAAQVDPEEDQALAFSRMRSKVEQAPPTGKKVRVNLPHLPGPSQGFVGQIGEPVACVSLAGVKLFSPVPLGTVYEAASATSPAMQLCRIPRLLGNRVDADILSACNISVPQLSKETPQSPALDPTGHRLLRRSLFTSIGYCPVAVLHVARSCHHSHSRCASVWAIALAPAGRPQSGLFCD
ncbi:unnamed protein product [Polarella glacialis]|uniref:Uncharacterized protein n=1 Tax=Polarella glacialis TaxID=89957 RepID=A0A813GHG8_POLGL|nr:unnamed protein product [Polarella glacialis]